jgi:hypothetical protein
MKLTEIKSQFVVGQQVLVTRAGNTPILIVGNVGNTTLPANNGQEIRTIAMITSKEWVTKKSDGKCVWTTFPKASEVLEAKVGYVRFQYDNGTIVTIEAAKE